MQTTLPAFLEETKIHSTLCEEMRNGRFDIKWHPHWKCRPDGIVVLRRYLVAVESTLADEIIAKGPFVDNTKIGNFPCL